MSTQEFTRIGHAQAGAHLEGIIGSRGVGLLVAQQDISNTVDWSIAGDYHAVIVHLGGPIYSVETEVDGIARPVVPLGIGEISLVPAGHTYLTQARGGVISFATMHVDAAAFRDAAGIVGGARELSLRLGVRDEFAYQAICRLAAVRGRTDDMAQMISTGVLHALCGHLYDSYRQGGAAPPGGKNKPALCAKAVNAVREYVHANLDRRIQLEDLARIADLRLRDLFVAFRNELRMTPVQYVIAQRLQRSRWLLQNTTQDIGEIALATGFASHSHLTTTFKKHSGLTPSEFRLRHAG